MNVNSASIQQNSDIMFSLLNQAQTQQNDVSQSIAKLATETKLNAQTDVLKGTLVDIFV